MSNAAPTSSQTLPRSPHDRGGADRKPHVAWGKGVVPGVLIALGSLTVVELVVLLSVIAGGFADLGWVPGLGLGGQLWLLSLGVPLDVSVAPLEGAGPVAQTVTLAPLGLSLLTASMAFLAGARMARRAPSGAGLAGVVLTTAVVHAAVAALVAAVTASGAAAASPWSAVAFGGLIVLAFTAAGALVAGGTPAALVGARAVETARQAGQDMRWAGSYLWAVLRAAWVAMVAAVAVGALVLAFALTLGWQQVIAIQQQLGSDAAGDTVFAVLHVALLPNFLVWALSWASGAGFYLGEGSLVSPAGTNAETIPLLPILGALPPQDAPTVLAAAPVLVVLCGLLAGWWFVREGENHLGEWIAIRIPWRVVSAPVVVVVSGLVIGAATAVLTAALAGLASGSLGLGRLSLVGPQTWEMALAVGIEVAVGAAVGVAVAPWVEQGRTLAATGVNSAPPADVSPRVTEAPHEPAASTIETPALLEMGPTTGEEGRPDPTTADGGPEESRGGSTATAKGKSKVSRGARERDREAKRREDIARKQQERSLQADRKAQKRYAAAEKRRARRKAARDR